MVFKEKGKKFDQDAYDFFFNNIENNDIIECEGPSFRNDLEREVDLFEEDLKEDKDA